MAYFYGDPPAWFAWDWGVLQDVRLAVLNVGKSQANQDKLVHPSLPSKMSWNQTHTHVCQTPHPPSQAASKGRKNPGPSGILSKGREAPPEYSSWSSQSPRPASWRKWTRGGAGPRPTGQGGDLRAGARLTSSPEPARVTADGHGSCLSPLPFLEPPLPSQPL